MLFRCLQVCEFKEHVPKFDEYGEFAVSQRKLNFADARSLCRAQYKHDIVTIYEGKEYKKTQKICINSTNDNNSSCWIGYQRGILNDNEWEWMQNIPITTIPINKLINTNIWTIDPWQNSFARIYCQGGEYMAFYFSVDGEFYRYQGRPIETMKSKPLFRNK